MNEALDTGYASGGFVRRRKRGGGPRGGNRGGKQRQQDDEQDNGSPSSQARTDLSGATPAMSTQDPDASMAPMPGRTPLAQPGQPMPPPTMPDPSMSDQTGYAAGGPVAPRDDDTVYPSTAPRWSMDPYASALAMQGGQNYARGGAVHPRLRDQVRQQYGLPPVGQPQPRVGYQEGGEVDAVDYATELAQREQQRRAQEDAAQAEAERPQFQPGYDQANQPDNSVLHKVMEYGRNLFGITPAQAEPAQAPADDPVARAAIAAYDKANAPTPPPTPTPTQTTPGLNRITFPSDQPSPASSDEGLLGLGARAVGRAVRSSIPQWIGGPTTPEEEVAEKTQGPVGLGVGLQRAYTGAKNDMVDYLNGDHALPADEMLRRIGSTQTINPQLDYSEQIRKTFLDTYQRDGADKAHQFVQALRGPQENARTLAVAALEHNAPADAVTLLEHSINMVPTADTTKITRYNDGTFGVSVQPHGGGQANNYHLSAKQMFDFATGPATQFDHIAHIGPSRTADVASGQPDTDPYAGVGAGEMRRNLQLLSDPRAVTPPKDEVFKKLEPHIRDLTQFVPPGYLNTQAARDALVDMHERGNYYIDRPSSRTYNDNAGIAQALMRAAPPDQGQALAASPPRTPAGQIEGMINPGAEGYQPGTPVTPPATTPYASAPTGAGQVGPPARVADRDAAPAAPAAPATPAIATPGRLQVSEPPLSVDDLRQRGLTRTQANNVLTAGNPDNPITQNLSRYTPPGFFDDPANRRELQGIIGSRQRSGTVTSVGYGRPTYVPHDTLHPALNGQPNRETDSALARQLVDAANSRVRTPPAAPTSYGAPTTAPATPAISAPPAAPATPARSPYVDDNGDPRYTSKYPTINGSLARYGLQGTIDDYRTRNGSRVENFTDEQIIDQLGIREMVPPPASSSRPYPGAMRTVAPPGRTSGAPTIETVPGRRSDIDDTGPVSTGYAQATPPNTSMTQRGPPTDISAARRGDRTVPTAPAEPRYVDDNRPIPRPVAPTAPPLNLNKPLNQMSPRELDAARAQLIPQDQVAAARRQQFNERQAPPPTPQVTEADRQQQALWQGQRRQVLDNYQALQKAAAGYGPAYVGTPESVGEYGRVLPRVETTRLGSAESSSSSTRGSSAGEHTSTGAKGATTSGTTSGSTRSDTSGSKSGHHDQATLIPGMAAQAMPGQADTVRNRLAANTTDAASYNAYAQRQQAVAQQALREYGPAPWERPGWHNYTDRPLPPSVFAKGAVAPEHVKQYGAPDPEGSSFTRPYSMRSPYAPAVDLPSRAGAAAAPPAAAPAAASAAAPTQAAAPAAASTTPVRVNSLEEARRLPSGTVFVGPDNVPRRVP